MDRDRAVAVVSVRESRETRAQFADQLLCFGPGRDNALRLAASLVDKDSS